MVVFLGTIILNIFLYVEIPKGFFPQQDTGRIIGGIRADQSISFQSMRRKFATSWASSATIRRSRTWSASPAASRPTPASCSPP
jgi:multidrug efflux pump subunit AcrB